MNFKIGAVRTCADFLRFKMIQGSLSFDVSRWGVLFLQAFWSYI
jgi:hypothetical protein